MIPPKARAATRAMVGFMGVLLVLSCLTGGVVGAGVLVLLVAAEGVRRYTLPHYRENRDRRRNCRHEWGETFEVGHSSRFFRMRFFAAHCVRCGEIQHRNEDGTLYVPARDRRDDGR